MQQEAVSQSDATREAAVKLQREERILECWDGKVRGDRLRTKYSGCYYSFQSLDGSISVEGGDAPTGSSSDIEAETPCVVMSLSKPITATVVMRTMQLRPRDWYPEKAMHEFQGWEAWRDFEVHADEAASGRGGRSEAVTLHQLLTHTSGFPFGLRGSRRQIRNTTLYYRPGTGCGYSIGHRLLAWMLLDYWREEARAKRVSGVEEFEDLQAIYSYLLYAPLGMKSTYFLRGPWRTPHSLQGEFLDMQDFDEVTDQGDDDPGDLSIVSTGADLMKLSLMALRRGRLAKNETFIARWEDWVGKNQLPEGKRSEALASWRVKGASRSLNLSLHSYLGREATGPHGYDYFGCTDHNETGEVVAVRVLGCSGCGIRLDYEKGIAFIAMQECFLADPSSRNLEECIVKGKVKEFSLSEVAETLIKYPVQLRERKRANYAKEAGRLTNARCQVSQPDPMLRLVQGSLRLLYRLALPLVARSFLRLDDRDHHM